MNPPPRPRSKDIDNVFKGQLRIPPSFDESAGLACRRAPTHEQHEAWRHYAAIRGVVQANLLYRYATSTFGEALWCELTAQPGVPYKLVVAFVGAHTLSVSTVDSDEFLGFDLALSVDMGQLEAQQILRDLTRDMHVDWSAPILSPRGDIHDVSWGAVDGAQFGFTFGLGPRVVALTSFWMD